MVRKKRTRMRKPVNSEIQTKFQLWMSMIGQSNLAKKLGLTRQMINHWANGTSRPCDSRKLQLIKLANGALDYNSFYPPIEF